ncbi:hypothetical protein Lser_V15G20368 [Lactuca serriola]
MLTFASPLFSLLLLLTTTTTSQPYKPTDYFLLNCGSSTTITTSDRLWQTDEHSKFVPYNMTTTSFPSTPYDHDPSVLEIPYSTARIFNTSSFTYSFPVNHGPKFLRLYFYPATYSHLNANQSFFSVSSNGHSLLSNFSAFLTSSYVGSILSNAGVHGPPVPQLIKEFIIYVNDTQNLNVTFTPSPNSYAFINGIEIVSLPETLYFKAKNLKYVGQITGPVIAKDTALESIYRLNVGGRQISVNDDTGMYRSWDGDENYIFPKNALGLTPSTQIPITYTTDTPNYTAPELVYQTERSMGTLSSYYNLTWILPVDLGFWYMLRLHFCSIIPQYTFERQMIFKIFINNQTAEDKADLFFWTPGSGYPVFKDYVVFVGNPEGQRSKQDLWLALHPNEESLQYRDGFLNGLEVFKMSMSGSLASPNPELSPTPPPPRPSSPGEVTTKKTPPYAAIIGGGGGGLVLLSALGFIVFWRTRKLVIEKSSGKPKSKKSGQLQSGRCRRFSVKEVKDATNEFNEECIIGKGGFGMVYKGYIDNATTMVAIKRLKSSSKQGFQEFQTEIGMLSKLRHVNLVPLIGYCDDEDEMVLVYDYMPHGTLREHLYNTNNPRLTWRKRLDICIGAAKGLHYLHTGANRVIIHRDIKSTNILLDENWVAKVSDFGLSKLGPKDERQNHVSTMVKGTFGYMDPDYFRMQQLTEKSDVYSFGVVLLEVLCARPVINIDLPYEEVSLAEWGKSHCRKGTLHEIIDPKLSGEIAPKCFMKFAEVANSCLQEKGGKRPSMDEVVWGLEFALQLQEAAEKTGGIVGEFVLEKQELLFPLQGESSTTSEGSSRWFMRHGMSSSDSSHVGLYSETGFSQMRDLS